MTDKQLEETIKVLRKHAGYFESKSEEHNSGFPILGVIACCSVMLLLFWIILQTIN